MTDYGHTKTPTVVTDTAAEYDLEVDHKYVHLDDLSELCNDVIEGNRLTVYVFEDEDRRSELRKKVIDFRGNYILAMGIEWPAWLADEIDEMDSELLTTLEWLLVINQNLTVNDLDYVRDVHGAMDVNGGCD